MLKPDLACSQSASNYVQTGYVTASFVAAPPNSLNAFAVNTTDRELLHVPILN